MSHGPDETVRETSNDAVFYFLCNFSFPLDPKRRQEWIRHIQDGNGQHLDETTVNDKRICGRHFEKDDFLPGGVRKFLKNTAIPRNFPENQSPNPQSISKKPCEFDVDDEGNYRETYEAVEGVREVRIYIDNCNRCESHKIKNQRLKKRLENAIRKKNRLDSANRRLKKKLESVYKAAYPDNKTPTEILGTSKIVHIVLLWKLYIHHCIIYTYLYVVCITSDWGKTSTKP
ncbi:uncharacterized protein LOC129809400 [Phlebotomus papatasi]|uniref:uncharacterized protein LOC129809400 n=1 Tax=Phlebotomus papatasi TaxID=29031 RepID=UPI002483BF22|nr:uncharacterized protein LOC129809400 [Phlebotomus papatasi]